MGMHKKTTQRKDFDISIFHINYNPIVWSQAHEDMIPRIIRVLDALGKLL